MSKKLAALLLVVVLVLGAVAFLFPPRDRGLTAAFAAALDILNTDIAAQAGGSSEFTPALDGDLLAGGDVVKASTEGRAVLAFFDGSSLTVDPDGVVKITTLDPIDNGGIRATVEQSLGRTWAFVSKLKTADSRFEIKTPTSSASVRGTAFETIVERLPDGTFSVTYKVDDGSIVVTANAGGQTTVTANTQVTIGQGQTAPAAPTPIPPSTSLRVTASAGLGFALLSPAGATCGPTGGQAEIPGCLVTGSVATIRDPVAGRYFAMLTSAAAAPGATLRVEALRGATVTSTQTVTRSFTAGELVRTAFTLGAQGLGAFEAAEPIVNVCGAQASGQIFAVGKLDDRYRQLESFAAANRSSPASLLVNQVELPIAIADAVENDISNGVVQISDVRATIDGSGIHLSGDATTPLGAFETSADVIVGTVNGKLALRLRNLRVGPLPSGLLAILRWVIERRMNEFAAEFPMGVRQVVLRPGCLGVIGSTRP